MEELKWLSESQVREIAKEVESPCYLYSELELRAQIEKALRFPVNDGYGFRPRFAMKSNPTKVVLKIMHEMGVDIDAGSEWEVIRAIRAGFEPNRVQLTAQQLPTQFSHLMELGVKFTACSLRQLEAYGKWYHERCEKLKTSTLSSIINAADSSTDSQSTPTDSKDSSIDYSRVGIRVNPGMGSGGCTKTNVGGSQSAFGIWHENINQVIDIASKYGLKITTVHSHIGSGSDPEVWKTCAKLTLNIAAKFASTCDTVNLGGGFKVARMKDEKSTDLQAVGAPVKELFEDFYKAHGTKLTLEIEPGSFYTVNMGVILGKVDDIIDTGANGYKFVKLNVGMDVILRPSLYGARHPVIIVPQNERTGPRESDEYVVAGHCCESGDLLTQEVGGHLQLRLLEKPHIDDYVVIGGAGAYCASMATKNYNSFPDAPEYLLQSDGSIRLVRKAQTLDQILQNEI